MLQDDFAEGTPVLLNWDTNNGIFKYKSSVLIKEGTLVGLAAVYDQDDRFVDFKEGSISLTNLDGSIVYDNIVLRVVHHKGTFLYLTYGKREQKMLNYARKFPRFPINRECTMNDRPAKLFDVSECGFGVIVQKEYHIGVWAQIEIEHKSAYGKIVHSKPIDTNTYFYGCEVDEPDASFIRFVREAEAAYEESISSI